MSEEPAGTLSKHGLREIPPAPDIDPEFKRYIEELYRIGRAENFEGMVNIIFTENGAFIQPFIYFVDRPDCITALVDALGMATNQWYEHDVERSEEETSE